MTDLKWKVCAPTTGRYRSFQKRGFPDADYTDGSTAVSLSCNDDYIPKDVKFGNHSEITIRIACYDVHEQAGAFTWRTLKQRAKTLVEAKQLAENFINQYPEIQPKSM
jgi:hypothetical protein